MHSDPGHRGDCFQSEAFPELDLSVQDMFQDDYGWPEASIGQRPFDKMMDMVSEADKKRAGVGKDEVVKQGGFGPGGQQ